MLELEQRPGESGDAGRALQVTDGCLDRGDRAAELVGRRAQFLEGPGEAADLDRVAEGGAGAVCLQAADGARVDAGAAYRLGDQRGLRLRVGDRVATGLAARVDGAALDHGEDLVAVALGVGERLEQYRADTLSWYEAVGTLVEDLAGAVPGQHVERGQRHVVRGVQDQVDAAHDGHPALAAAQALDGEVDRRQRGGAGGVDGEAGALEVEVVGDPVGDRPVRGVRAGEFAARPAGGGEPPVRAVHDTGEHARHRLVRGAVEVTGPVEQVPAGLQEEAFLRVDVTGVARQDVEEGRVELVDVVEESAPPAVAAVAAAALGVEGEPPVPAVGGDLGDGVPAVLQVAPEGLHVRRARVASTDGDHRDVGGPVPRCRAARGRLRGRHGRCRLHDRGGRGYRGGHGHRGCVRDGRYRLRGFGRWGGFGRWRGGTEQRGQPLGAVGAQVVGELIDGEMLEQEGGGQHTEVLLHPVHDVLADQRIDPVRLEGRVVVEFGGTELQHLGEDLPYVAADLGRGQRRCLLGCHVQLPFARHQALLELVLGGAGDAAHPRHPESGIGEGGPPLGGSEQRRVRETALRVLESPPALGEAEGEGDELGGAGHLVHGEHPTGAQQGADVGQGAADVPGGVQHVGGQHDVGAVRLEALCGGVALDVQQLVTRAGGAVVGFAVAQEGRRDVGVAVCGRQAGRGTGGQHVAGGGAGAGPDLDDPQRPAAGEPLRGADHLGGHQPVEVLGAGSFGVDRFDEGGRALREQHLGGGDPAGQDAGEAGHACPQQRQVRRHRGVGGGELGDRQPLRIAQGAPEGQRAVAVQGGRAGPFQHP